MMSLAVVYWGIVLLNIIAFLTGRHIKWISIPTALFLILFVMGKRPVGDFMIGLDYYTYENIYNNIYDYFTLDFGYRLVNVIGNALSLPFETFYMVVLAAIIIILIIAVVRLESNLHLFLVSYLIYFDMITIDLIRNQCAIAILILFTFSSLYKKKKFWPGWLLASTFHTSFYLFSIPFYLTQTKSIFIARKWMITVIVFCALIYITGTIDIIKSLLNFILSFFSGAEDRYAHYMAVNAKHSFILPFFVYFIVLYGLRFWKQKCINRNDERMLYYAEYVYKFALFCSIFLVLTFIDVHLYRYTRDLSLIGIIFMGVNMTGKSTRFNERFVIMFCTLIITFGWFFFDVIVKGYFAEFATTFYMNVIL